MNSNFEVYLSNKVEHLADTFKAKIYSSKEHPLISRMVIVSTPAIKSWLMLQLAKDADIGIAAGMEIYYLDEAIDRLKSHFSSSKSKKLPSLMELSLALERQIRLVSCQFPQMTFEEQQSWASLLKYLHIIPGKPLSKKSEMRLIALSSKLASLFKQYGKYGSKLIDEWENDESNEWQVKLWQQLFCQNSPWTYLYRELNQPFDDTPKNLQIHLFSISHIPPLFHQFLNKFSQYISLKYYLLSPCQFFWSDIRSDRETHRLTTFWKANGASESQLETLEEYLRDRNPLLANFGLLGRQMAQLIDRSSPISFEKYTVSEKIIHYPQLESLIDHTTELLPSSANLTVLEAVQTDILLLRNPSASKDKLSFGIYDETIQIHCSGSKLREIQAVQDLIIGLLKKHQNDAEPLLSEDIIVMAPNICEYEPFIKVVFQDIDTHIMDLHIPSQNSSIQAFLHLLSIGSSRWDASTFLQLFEYKMFQKKQQLEPEDITQIKLWIKEAGIRWGINHHHRTELLEKNHCLNASSEQSSSNTWEAGFDRLLMGLISRSEDKDDINVSTTQSELLGKFLNIMKSIREDLKMLSQGSFLTLKDWVAYLQNLHNTYFADPGDQSEVLTILEEVLYTLGKTHRFFQQDEFSFQTIYHHVKVLLNQHKTNYRESRLNCVVFCSLLPLRTIPAKVSVLLGLQEEAFPRSDQSTVLNLMVGNSKADYVPSQIDLDRYLFLEALLSARQYFIMSYIGHSEKDFKEQIPSLLVTEMLNYFDKAYEIQGEILSKVCQFKHPFQSFDASYFLENNPLKSYSQTRYAAAAAYYQKDKEKPFNLISSFHIKPCEQPLGDIHLNLSDLKSHAKNPLKTYFNKRLGIYLNQDTEKIVKTEENLLPTFLQFDALKKASFNKSLPELIAFAQQKNILPPRLFKDVSIETLKDKVAEIHHHLKEIEVNPAELFDIEFSEHYNHPLHSQNGNWHYPPLLINFKETATIHIVGKLKGVSTKGLVENIKDEKDVFQAWPSFLVLQCLTKKHDLNIKTDLLFIKSGLKKSNYTNDPFEELTQYLDYYFTSLESPSPLLPEWIPLLIKEDNQIVLEKLKSVKPNYKSSYNTYLNWYLNYYPLSDSVLEWKQTAQQLFGQAYQEWFIK